MLLWGTACPSKRRVDDVKQFSVRANLVGSNGFISPSFYTAKLDYLECLMLCNFHYELHHFRVEV